MSKVIVFGGITGGIGSAIAELLKAEGAVVEGFAHHDEANIANIDVCKSEEIDGFIQSVVEKHGRIDGYVHAVGSVFLKPGHLTSDEEFKEVVDVNLFSAFYALRACVKVMQKQKSGSMLFFSSVAGKIGLPNHEAIAAAKGGVSGLVKAAAATYAHSGVRINGIAPGLVETKGTEAIVKGSLKVSEQMHPLGRIGQPEDIASLAKWLILDESSWVTGQVWSVDGGMADLMQRSKA